MKVVIDALYIGNGSKSFFEDRLIEGINIIFSDDNNVGKTIVMQGIMFALGSSPAFPESFPFRDYIFIVDTIINNERISILRSRNTFAIKNGETVMSFDSVDAFQKYWSANIQELPVFIKNNRAVMAGFELYSQMYFITQDGRSSSRISAGRFNKQDFIEMLYAIEGLNARELAPSEIAELKKEKASLIEQRKSFLKQTKILRSKDVALSTLSPTVDREEMKDRIDKIREAKELVADLKKQRGRILRRLTKNEITQKELNSLRLDVKAGALVCLECGSNRVGYKMADSGFTFDVTTPQMRNQVLDSIQRRIDACNVSLEQINEDLRSAQTALEKLFEEKPVTLADVVASQEGYRDVRDLDLQITEIDDKIAGIEEQLQDNSHIEAEVKDERKEFMDKLIDTMNFIHQQISENNTAERYDSLFTSSSRVYSGSETTEYFLSRTYSLAVHIGHGMPILVDSFRAEDLSTSREEKAINLFKKITNQVIFTTTVKEEEGSEKYQNIAGVSSIDYSDHEPFKLLTSEYNEIFEKKMKLFGAFLCS